MHIINVRLFIKKLKDNNINGIYTANVDDFAEFEFLEVINPLA
jgi:hypothetical protein